MENEVIMRKRDYESRERDYESEIMSRLKTTNCKPFSKPARGHPQEKGCKIHGLWLFKTSDSVTNSAQ